jgi:hypothetical protein
VTGARFVRFQSPQVSERGINVGVFPLVNLLGKHGRLTPEDEHLRRTRNRWFDDAYDVAWERVESDDPGRVVYEDPHQVVVVPQHAGADRR